MTWQDGVNALFNVGGGVFQWVNVYRLIKDREIKGVSKAPFAFFAIWGCWNLLYYPHLGQTLSLIGGVFIVLANMTWVVLAVLYGRRRK